MSDQLQQTSAGPVLLGLDLGTKRSGVAIAKHGLATEYDTLTEPNMLVQSIVDICKKELVTKIIIGLPLNNDHTESDQSGWVRKQVESIVAATRLPVVFEDEYLTSTEARQQLLALGLSADQIKTRLDSKSAQLLLEQYLTQEL